MKRWMAAGALALAGLVFATAESWGQSPEQAVNASPASAAPAKPSSAGTETGFATFQTKCMSCHGNPNVPRAPRTRMKRWGSDMPALGCAAGGPRPNLSM